MKRTIRPGPWADALVYGVLCFTWGGLIVGALVHEHLYRPERVERLEAEETIELLVEHSDYQACAMVETALYVRGVPGFGRVVQLGDVAAQQIPGESTLEVLRWCRGER